MLVEEEVIDEFFGDEPESLVVATLFGDVIIVLSGQETTCHWTPDGRAITMSIEQGSKFHFDTFPAEEVILELVGNGSMKAKSITDVDRFLNLFL